MEHAAMVAPVGAPWFSCGAWQRRLVVSGVVVVVAVVVVVVAVGGPPIG